MRGDLVAVRRVVYIDLGIGRRTIFKEHFDELAERLRKSPERARFDAPRGDEPGELKVKLDPEQEAALLQAIDDWMRDARALPDDVLALRQALRRHGI